MTKRKRVTPKEQRLRLHSAVAAFAFYAEINLPVQIANGLRICESIPRDLRNVTICYLLNNAIDGSISSLMGQLAEAADLIRKTYDDLAIPGDIPFPQEVQD